MSTKYLEERIVGIRERAKQITSEGGRAIRDVKANDYLSDQGKREEIERVRGTYKARLKSLRIEEETLIDTSIRDLERELDAKSGHTSSDLIAFRDAQDRAERISKEDDANRVLDRALRTSDTTLAFAIFRRAVDNHWRGTVSKFVAEKPGVGEAVSDLQRLQELKEDTFARSFTYGLLDLG